ncbi:MAG: chromosomal replication initiator protein DnaA [Gammaproteobacteria bacterium]|nr:chromosomal replication initiator protein DnaA [Gammaproteobacteria bacterium]
MSSNPLWANCVRRLESEFDPGLVSTYIHPLQHSLSETALTLYAPNRFVQQELQARFGDRIAELARAISGLESFKVVYSTGGPQKAASAVPNPTSAKPKQMIASAGLIKNYTFDAFVEGKSNQFARAASMATASEPGVRYNPLVIFGPYSVGKTHLMHAVGNAIKDANHEANVVCMSAEDYFRRMVAALRSNSMDEFKRSFRNVNALLIDDIQFFANKDRTQEEFFHLFNALLDTNKQIVLTCDQFPMDVTGIEGRLRSRFAWGLVAEIERPELEVCVAIIHAKAERNGHQLPDDVALLIADRGGSTVRELEGALNRVIAQADFQKQPITIELAKRALRETFASRDRRISVDNIQRNTCEFFKLSMTELLSASRARRIARPRQMSMALAKQLTDSSLNDIGKAFGDRDHTTVMHAVKKVDELLQTDERFSKDYQALMRILQE